MKLKIYAIAALMLLSLVGCASENLAANDPNHPHAECLVCKMNVDLACVDVPVDDKTPRYMYNGQDYYFCSNDCLNKFQANPGKYAKK